MIGLEEDMDGMAEQTAPVWAVFGDLMAGLLGAFVLVLVGVLVVQIDLVASLKQEVEKRQMEERRRMALEKALAVPLDAVRTDQPLPYVHTVAHDQVQHTPVVLGVQSVDSARPWVAVEGLPEGTIVLGGRVGGIPAGTSVQLEAQHPSTAAAAAAAAAH